METFITKYLGQEVGWQPSLFGLLLKTRLHEQDLGQTNIGGTNSGVPTGRSFSVGRFFCFFFKLKLMSVKDKFIKQNYHQTR